MLASTKEELQELMDRLNETSNKHNMRINVEKTKTMCVSRCRKQINLTIAGKSVEQESRFLHLGARITEDGQTIEDTKTRIALARKEVFRKKRIIISRP